MPQLIAPGVFDHPVDSHYLQLFISNPANVLMVAIADETVVGMATGIAYAHPDKAPQLFIVEVGVDDAYQRRGIGTALINALLLEGAKQGCQEAWVPTEGDNTSAIDFYRSMNARQERAQAVVFTFSINNDAVPKQKEANS